jgi:hypothetical protein
VDEIRSRRRWVLTLALFTSGDLPTYAYGLKEHSASRSLTYHQIIADPRDLIVTK